MFGREAKTKTLTQKMLTKTLLAGVRAHTPLIADRHREYGMERVWRGVIM